MRKIVKTSKAPIFDVPLVQGTTFGDRVFTAGMVGCDAKTMRRGTTFEEQTRLVMDNLINTSRVAGMEPDEIIKCTAFIRDMTYLETFDHIYKEYFGKKYPARTIYAVPSLAGPYDMEVEAFGYQSAAGKNFEVIHTDRAPAPGKYQVQGIKVGNFIYTSSQAPIDVASGKPVEAFDKQIRCAIQNMIAVVEAGGGKKENIIKNLVFLTDMSKFDDFNPVYGEFFQKDNNPPARSCFGVTALSGMSQIEIECVAYIGENRETLHSPNAPVLNFPFCQGIRAEEMVFVSGQVGYDPKTGKVPETFEGQTRIMMENMLAVAKEAGAGPDDFVKTTCFLTDIGQFAFFNQIYREYFHQDFPARSAFQCNRLSYQYLIEIDGIACVKK